MDMNAEEELLIKQKDNEPNMRCRNRSSVNYFIMEVNGMVSTSHCSYLFHMQINNIIFFSEELIPFTKHKDL